MGKELPAAVTPSFQFKIHISNQLSREMKNVVFLLLLLLSIAHSFQWHSAGALRKIGPHTAQQGVERRLFMSINGYRSRREKWARVLENEPVEKTESEKLIPATPNPLLLGKLFTSQALILIGGLLSSHLHGMDVIQVKSMLLTFDALKLTAACMAAMVGALACILVIPGVKTQALNMTKGFCFGLIGSDASVGTAALISLIVGLSAGVSEEIFFRGYLINALKTGLPDPAPLLISSALFGLAHYPGVAMPALAGAVLGWGYESSGQNLLVPMAAHTLYDFVIIFFTWCYASQDLHELKFTLMVTTNVLKVIKMVRADVQCLDFYSEQVRFMHAVHISTYCNTTFH
jgi:membrane protease YdiL (CAAX protease family)